MSLSLKQQAFVTAYLGEAKGNATQAAIMAGYSEKAASQVAHQVLRTPKVAEAIQARLDVHDIRTDAILKRLAKLAYSVPDKVTGSDVVQASKVILQVNGALQQKDTGNKVTIILPVLQIQPNSQQPLTLDTTAIDAISHVMGAAPQVMGQQASVLASPEPEG